MSSRKRPLIMHIMHRFDVGGLENGVVNLINHMDENLFDHVIVAMEGFNPAFCERLQRDVPVYSVDKQPGKDLGVYFRLFRLIKRLKPSIVHTRNLSAIEAQLPAFLAGVRYRIHGEHGWDVYDPRGDVKKYQVIRRLFGNFIHKFVPLSKELERYLVNKVGIKQSKINRICNGVDLSRFNAAVTEGVNDWPFSSDELVIGCVGRLEIIKGHIDLLKAVHILNNQNLLNNLKLCLVGEGSQRAELTDFIARNKLENTVWLAGNRANVPEFMARFSVFVLPSHAEGISNTILEAMAAKLPIIATDVGGNSDLIEAGQTGIVVPSKSPDALAKAIVSLMSDHAKLTEFGVAGFERVNAQFSLTTMVNNYTRLYQKNTI